MRPMSSRRKSHHDWYTSQRTLPALGAGARLASPVVMPVSASEARTSAMVVVHGPADGALKMISSTVSAVRVHWEAPQSWSLPFNFRRNRSKGVRTTTVHHDLTITT